MNQINPFDRNYQKKSFIFFIKTLFFFCLSIKCLIVCYFLSPYNNNQEYHQKPYKIVSSCLIKTLFFFSKYFTKLFKQYSKLKHTAKIVGSSCISKHQNGYLFRYIDRYKISTLNIIQFVFQCVKHFFLWTFPLDPNFLS